MNTPIKDLIKEVVKYSFILLVTFLLISLLGIKESSDCLLIYLVGWVTALLNFFLLAFFIISLHKKEYIWIGIPAFALRYGIYAISMIYCIHSTMQAIYWSGGIITMVIAIMIGGITSQNRKEE